MHCKVVCIQDFQLIFSPFFIKIRINSVNYIPTENTGITQFSNYTENAATKVDLLSFFRYILTFLKLEN